MLGGTNVDALLAEGYDLMDIAYYAGAGFRPDDIRVAARPREPLSPRAGYLDSVGDAYQAARRTREGVVEVDETAVDRIIQNLEGLPLDTSSPDALEASLIAHAEAGHKTGDITLKKVTTSGRATVYIAMQAVGGKSVPLAAYRITRDGAARRAMAEVAALRELDGSGVPVARIIDVRRLPDGSVMETLEVAPGESIGGLMREMRGLEGDEREAHLQTLEAAAAKAAEDLAEVHEQMRCPPRCPEGADSPPGGWTRPDVDSIDHHLALVEGIDIGSRREALSLAESAAASLEAIARRTAMAHGDYQPNNYIASIGENGDVAGTIIDWDGASYGPDGSGAAHPGVDIGRFLGWMYDDAQRFGMGQEEAQRMWNAFTLSYLRSSGMSPREFAAAEALYQAEFHFIMAANAAKMAKAARLEGKEDEAQRHAARAESYFEQGKAYLEAEAIAATEAHVEGLLSGRGEPFPELIREAAAPIEAVAGE
jgi:aminoglycoside phosphotransferase (APT) family kinase protein